MGPSSFTPSRKKVALTQIVGHVSKMILKTAQHSFKQPKIGPLLLKNPPTLCVRAFRSKLLRGPGSRDFSHNPAFPIDLHWESGSQWFLLGNVFRCIPLSQWDSIGNGGVGVILTVFPMPSYWEIDLPMVHIGKTSSQCFPTGKTNFPKVSYWGSEFPMVSIGKSSPTVFPILSYWEI